MTAVVRHYVWVIDNLSCTLLPDTNANERLTTMHVEEDTHMPDLSPYPDSYPDAGAESGGGSTTGPPRWVKVLGIIALVLVLLVGAVMLAGGGGGHGPGRHTSGGDTGGQRPPFTATGAGGLGGHKPPSTATGSGGPGGHKPPAGGHTP